MSAGLCFLKALSEDPFLPFPGFWWLLVILGVPWHAAVPFPTLLFHCHMIFSQRVCFPMSKCLSSYKETIILDLMPTIKKNIKTLFIIIPVLVYFWIIRMDTHLLGSNMLKKSESQDAKSLGPSIIDWRKTF